MKKTDKKKLKIVVDGVHQIISGLLSVDADEDQNSHNSITNPNNSTEIPTNDTNKQKSDKDTTDII
jgi:hypothetical protein